MIIEGVITTIPTIKTKMSTIITNKTEGRKMPEVMLTLLLLPRLEEGVMQGTYLIVTDVNYIILALAP